MFQGRLPHTERLTALDGLRGVAALAVLYVHTATLAHLPGMPSLMAVDLFFLMSGFVIPYAYEAKLQAGMSFARFAEARLVRLYPLYILGCGVSMVMACYNALGGGLWMLREPVHRLGWAVFLLPQPHWEAGQSFLLNPPAWTLFLELVVNFLYALLLPRLTTKVVGALCVVLALLLLAGVTLFQTIDFGTGGVQLAWGLVRVACPYTIGLFLFRLWQSDVMPVWRTSPLLPIGLFVGASVLLPGGSLLSAWTAYAVGLVVFPIILLLIVDGRATGRLGRMLGRLGDLSYPLYALHIPLIFAAIDLGRAVGLPQRPSAIIGALLAIPIAGLASRFYDGPIRRKLSHMLALRRRSAERAPAI